MPKQSDQLIIISGPSGAGEDSVIAGLKKKGFEFTRVITTVTRKKRLGEKQGQPYYFISVDKFKKMIKQKKFIEWAYVYKDYRGCTFNELKRIKQSHKIGIWKVDYQGVKSIKKKVKGAIAIYIKPPSLAISIERIRKRKLDSTEEIQKRIKFTKEWLNPQNDQLYDYVVINHEGKLDQTVEKVGKIIKDYTSNS